MAAARDQLLTAYRGRWLRQRPAVHGERIRAGHTTNSGEASRLAIGLPSSLAEDLELHQTIWPELFEVPGSRLLFDDSQQERQPTAGSAIDHIGFEVRDRGAFVDSLERTGIEFEFGPAYIESLDLRVAFFGDPGGVFVEITHGLDRF